MSAHNDDAYVDDILLAAHQIKEYTQGVSRAKWLESRLIQDAVIRQLTIIGEGAAELSDSFKKSVPEIPWHKIKGFRNIAVHQYWEVDSEAVWDIVKQSVPKLIKALK